MRRCTADRGRRIFVGMLRVLFAAIVSWSGAGTMAGEKLTVVSYNVESGDADPAVVGVRVADFLGVDIWGFSEVKDATWATTFEAAAAVGESAAFRSVLGTTGREDRLLIVYNDTRLQMIEHFELHRINSLRNVRSSLVARLRLRSTGQEFLFMVNHLWRGSERGRHKQAQKLNDWARGQSLPVIAVGDYNFDWDVTDGDSDHDEGYDLMTDDGVFQWTRPAQLHPSQTNPSFQSVLDFVFTAGAAQAWPARSEIIVQPGDAPDNAQISDHRPLKAEFDLVAVTPHGVAPLAAGAAAGGAPPSRPEKNVEGRLKEIEDRLKRIERLRERPAAGGRAAVRSPQIPADFPKRSLVSAAGDTVPLTGDSDRDGLTDAEEATLGTDPTNPDTDGDALLDGWEVHGVNGVDLRAMGANPLHKDIFVEMDYMERATAANGLGPNDVVLSGIEQVFATALVMNPDGRRGIAIHLDRGNKVPYDGNLQPAAVEFAALKRIHFDSKRAPAFHYMIWADRYNGGTSSGNAFAIPNSDFIVTLGGWNANQGGTDLQKIGTFVHELGHDLGLMHGGSEHLNNKPNHLSVMNYSFQTRGILRGGRREFDYQRFPLPALHEDSLIERFGLGGSSSLLSYFTIIQSASLGSREVPAHGSIDWNGDGTISEEPISVDLNNDLFLGELLATPDEWSRLVFNGGSIGSTDTVAGALKRMDDSRRLLPVVELTEEMDKALK